MVDIKTYSTVVTSEIKTLLKIYLESGMRRLESSPGSAR